VRRAIALLVCAVSLGACGSSDDEGETPAKQARVGAPGVTVTKVAVYQTLEHVLEENGTAVQSSVPLLENKDAIVRVFYATDDTFDGAPVHATLAWGDGPSFESEETLYLASSDAALQSTLVFHVPKERVLDGASYSVAIEQDREPALANAAARYPAEGTATLPSLFPGRTLHLVIVPLVYQADGSNREPDTSAEQLALIHDYLVQLYPIADVQLDLHDPVPLAADLSTLTGWSEALADVMELRATEAPLSDVYYMGLVRPSETLVSSTAAIDGLGNIPLDPADASLRAALAIGYTGEPSAYTLAHELGHLHGRYHSPCGGAAGPDPDYPHALAGIGVTGYDASHEALVLPQDFRDLMGYCDPRWVSDYTYGALHARAEALGSVAPLEVDGGWSRVAIAPNGVARWLSPGPAPRGGERVTARVQVRAGSWRELEARFHPYDHLDGGVLMLPAPTSDIIRVTTTLAGRSVTFTSSRHSQ
jgi:hypothetical protein